MSADSSCAVVVRGGSVSVVYSDPLREPPEVAARLRPIVGDLLRALAPALPPRDQWPDEWCEIHDERVAICLEAGVPEAEALATADAELRVHAWRTKP